MSSHNTAGVPVASTTAGGAAPARSGAAPGSAGIPEGAHAASAVVSAAATAVGAPAAGGIAGSGRATAAAGEVGATTGAAGSVAAGAGSGAGSGAGAAAGPRNLTNDRGPAGANVPTYVVRSTPRGGGSRKRAREYVPPYDPDLRPTADMLSIQSWPTVDLSLGIALDESDTLGPIYSVPVGNMRVHTLKKLALRPAAENTPAARKAARSRLRCAVCRWRTRNDPAAPSRCAYAKTEYVCRTCVDAKGQHIPLCSDTRDCFEVFHSSPRLWLSRVYYRPGKRSTATIEQ